MGGHRPSIKMDTVMMRLHPVGYQVEAVQTDPDRAVAEIIEGSPTVMVKNHVEVLLNLVSFKIYLLQL